MSHKTVRSARTPKLRNFKMCQNDIPPKDVSQVRGGTPRDGARGSWLDFGLPLKIKNGPGALRPAFYCPNALPHRNLLSHIGEVLIAPSSCLADFVLRKRCVCGACSPTGGSTGGSSHWWEHGSSICPCPVQLKLIAVPDAI